VQAAGDLILASAWGGEVILWDGEGRELRRWDGIGRRTSVSPDGRRFASAAADGQVSVRALDGTGAAVELGRLDRLPMGVRWSPDGQWLAAIDERGGVIFGKPGGTARKLAGLPPPQHGGVDVAFSADSRWLFPGRTGRLRIFSLEGGEDRPLATDEYADAWATAFTPDGKTAVSTAGDGSIDLWSTATGERHTRIPNPTTVMAVRFSPDGSLLYTGSMDHMVRTWDVRTGGELDAQPAPEEVYGLFPSPDGTRLLVTTPAPR
jgi:WD40 repeat protein